MSKQKLIVVLGITGTQGYSVANRFLKHNSWHIRGVTRNVESERAKAWVERGVEMVQADQNDVRTLKSAFRGANAIFAVTDFGGNYAKVSEDEQLQKEDTAGGRTIDEYAYGLEVAQGINIATAAADPEVLATLEKFVFSTLTAVKRVSGGKYTHAYEFDSKAHVEQHIRENEPELSRRMSTLIMGIYQESWKSVPVLGPLKEKDGTFSFARLKWPGQHLSFPEVIASKDTGAFVEALVLHHPPDTSLLGASEIISRADYAALWGRVMGVKASVRDLSAEEFARSSPEEYRDGLLDMVKFFVEYGYTGGDAKVKTPSELGIETTLLEDFIKNEDWSSVETTN